MCLLRELTLEITRECMNHCLHCSSRALPHNSNRLKTESLIGLIQEASEIGLHSLSISGGEPFLHPDYHRILKECHAPGIRRVLVYTSGVARDANGLASPLDWSMLRVARDINATLVFSVHSDDPNVHDRIARRAGGLQLCFESLQRATKVGVSIECHIVPNQLNIATVASTAHRLIDMGVLRVSFLRLVPQGYAAQHLDKLITSDSSEAYLELVLRKLSLENGADQKYRFGIPFSRCNHQISKCQAGTSKLIMRWDGAFFPCEAFKECGVASFCLGRIGESSLEQMLRSAMENQTLRHLRQQAGNADPCPAQYLYQHRARVGSRKENASILG